MNEQSGKPSSMRLMCMFALIVAAVLAANKACGWYGDGGDNSLILYFLAAAFGPKAVQRFAEKDGKS